MQLLERAQANFTAQSKAVNTQRLAGAMMDVALVNDGPVTVIVDSEEPKKSREWLDSNND